MRTRGVRPEPVTGTCKKPEAGHRVVGAGFEGPGEAGRSVVSLRKFTPGLLPGFLPPVGWRADSGSREDGAPSHRWGRTGRRGCLTPRAGHRDAHGPPARLPTTERSCFLRCALKQLPKRS